MSSEILLGSNLGYERIEWEILILWPQVWSVHLLLPLKCQESRQLSQIDMTF